MLVPDGFIMQFAKAVLILCLIALCYASYSNSNDSSQLDSWVEFCPKSQLCFQRPTSLTPIDVLALDSIAGQLEHENITLTYDLGRYSSKFNDLTHAAVEAVIIDGHDGKLLIQDKKMALTIPTVSGKIGFSMLIEFKNTVQLEQGLRILRSVKFNLPH